MYLAGQIMTHRIVGEHLAFSFPLQCKLAESRWSLVLTPVKKQGLQNWWCGRKSNLCRGWAGAHCSSGTRQQSSSHSGTWPAPGVIQFKSCCSCGLWQSHTLAHCILFWIFFHVEFQMYSRLSLMKLWQPILRMNLICSCLLFNLFAFLWCPSPTL